MDNQQPSERKDPLNTTTGSVIVPPPSTDESKKNTHQHASFVHRKSVLPILFAVLIMIVGLGVGLMFMQNSQDIRSKASNTSSVLALSPATKTATVGETFSIGATINTNEDTVSAAEFHLTYDPSAIQIIDFTPQTGLVVLVPETHANGTIAVTLGVPPTAPFKGAGIVGTWTVKALANKQSSIAFTSTTQVAALGKSTNALASTNGSTITTENVTATATPTPIRTPTPTHVPSGTPTTAPLTPTPTPISNPADIDGNGGVNIIDYTLYMSAWFLNNLDVADLNDDGRKSVIDYTIFMNGWNDYLQ